MRKIYSYALYTLAALLAFLPSSSAGTATDKITMTPQASPTCASGKACVYAKSSDSRIYMKDAAGLELGSNTARAFRASSSCAGIGSPAVGDVCFDTTGFVREYPWPVRRVVYRELMKIAPQHSNVDFVVRDIAVQLYRQQLDPWVDVVLRAARDRHGVHVDAADAKKTCESDAKFFPTLLRLKRAQRAWMQRTRRRYDTLLPDRSSFG